MKRYTFELDAPSKEIAEMTARNMFEHNQPEDMDYLPSDVLDEETYIKSGTSIYTILDA